MVQLAKSGDVYNRMERLVGSVHDMRCGCIGMALWIPLGSKSCQSLKNDYAMDSAVHLDWPKSALIDRSGAFFQDVD